MERSSRWILKAIFWTLIILISTVFFSCGKGKLQDAEQLQSLNTSNIRDMVDDLEGSFGTQAKDRVVIIEQLIKKMEGENKNALIPPFLNQYISRYPNEPYNCYYLFLIGQEYEKMNSVEPAILYYHNSLNTNSDVIVQSNSVHLMSIKQLLDLPLEAIEKIDLYTELLNHFQDSIDLGSTYYYLASSYEQAGQYQEAIRNYVKFLDYPQTVIPGKINEQQRVRELLNMADASRDWTRENLDQLISEIKSALMQKDFSALSNLQAKVNFFSMSWLQEKADFNSQVNYDLRRFLLGSEHIYFENKLEGNSNSQEAYLKTWGWSSYMPIWYLYFRRVNYPADPEIHGNWEWVGIYFGSSLQ